MQIFISGTYGSSAEILIFLSLLNESLNWNYIYCYCSTRQGVGRLFRLTSWWAPNDRYLLGGYRMPIIHEEIGENSDNLIFYGRNIYVRTCCTAYWQSQALLNPMKLQCGLHNFASQHLQLGQKDIFGLVRSLTRWSTFISGSTQPTDLFMLCGNMIEVLY
jgi:hypothetical protein